MKNLFIVLLFAFLSFSHQLSQESKSNLLTCVTIIQFLLYGDTENTKEAVDAIMAHSSDFDEKAARNHLMSLFAVNCYRSMTKELQLKISNEFSQKKKLSLKSKEISSLVDYKGIVDMYNNNDTVSIVKMVKEFKEIEKIMNSEDFHESSFYSASGDLGLLGFSISSLTPGQKNLIGLVLFAAVGGVLAFLLKKLMTKEEKKKKKKQK